MRPEMAGKPIIKALFDLAVDAQNRSHGWANGAEVASLSTEFTRRRDHRDSPPVAEPIMAIKSEMSDFSRSAPSKQF